MGNIMEKKLNIAGYARISVDDDLDRDNTSIENQKSIISDFVAKNFPDALLTFFSDRDRSGYTFTQREGYQEMRPFLMNGTFDILIIKDFSRFSRRNSRGLVELEDLRDAGVRIISIGDSIDYPTYDDWTAIQFRFLVNEMPVTDASKKVRSVIKRRQEEGKWICSVPYGYAITNSKKMEFEIQPDEAEVVRLVFKLYISGWGYKKISNHLTDLRIPTPRMKEKMRKEARGEECKLRARPEWSILTIQDMLQNDFYIGTLRQGKYSRKNINGADVKKDEKEHIVFENHHESIIEYKDFLTVSEMMKQRTTSCYRGIKKYENAYSGLMYCGDCGSPMYPGNAKRLGEVYKCGLYHRRGLKGCTSHYTKVDTLDSVIKIYLSKIKETSSEMIASIKTTLNNEDSVHESAYSTLSVLEKQLLDAKTERKSLMLQYTRELNKHPEREDRINEMFDELLQDNDDRIVGIENQFKIASDKYNSAMQVSRVAKTALDVFDEILEKDRLSKQDVYILIDRITVYEDYIHIKLKNDIEQILQSGLPEMEDVLLNFNSDTIDILKFDIVQKSDKHLDKVYSVNVISSGDPSQTTLTQKELFIAGVLSFVKRIKE